MQEKNHIIHPQEKPNSWILFAVLSFSCFIKIILVHYAIFHSFAIPDDEINSFWLNKIVMVLVIASPIFLFNRQWIHSLFIIIIDFWLLSNVLYHRANSLFLNMQAVRMADNLMGFEDSIKTLLSADILIFILLSITSFIVLPIIAKRIHFIRNVKKFTITIGITFLLMIISHIPTWYTDYSLNKKTRDIREGNNVQHFYHTTKRLIIPFYDIMHIAKFGIHDWEKDYFYTNSGIHYGAAIIIHDITERYFVKAKPLSQEDIDMLLSRHIATTKNKSYSTPTSNLIVIFVESLESWALSMQDANGHFILPHLSAWSANANFYCGKIRSQVKNGVSGDGQLLCNTGLLPLNSGASCLLYPHNTYPNFATRYNKSVLINPWPGIWGQDIVTYSYGYNELCEPKNTENDLWVFKKLIEKTSQVEHDNFCLFAITISSHMPFHSISGHGTYPKNMPKIMQDYLSCLHYTDSCLGLFLDYMDQSPLSKNTSLIITGDHTVFKEHILRNFESYARQENLPIKDGKNYVPLIIKSPSLTGTIVLEDEYYQMDIFPTLLHLIGCDDYYWKGFGVNLLDEEERNKRPCSDKEAYRLSDLLIRNNWFAN